MDSPIEVTLVGDSALVVKLKKVEAKVTKALVRGIKRVTIYLSGVIKEKYLSGFVLRNRTGNLRRAVFPDAKGIEGRVAVGKEAPYGRFHEFGVAHAWTITPRKKKALAFMVGGVKVVRRSVTHPGLAERSFMRRGLKEHREQIVAMLAKAVQEGLNERT